MYVHAYQSYVWNAIVSERIQKYGRKPIVGDLVFESATSSMAEATEQAEDGLPDTTIETEVGSNIVNDNGMSLSRVTFSRSRCTLLEVVPPVEDEETSMRFDKKDRKAWQPPRVKVLAAEDLDKFSMFDVIMPLPGTDVAYPEGPLGERYREFLRLDGLDPDDFSRKQK